jgi:hypothetical protein
VKKQVKSAVAVFLITSLDAREAAPMHLARYVRGQWTIENKVHYATLLTVRIPPGSGPARVPVSWPPSVTSPSGSSAKRDTPKSLPPSAR